MGILQLEEAVQSATECTNVPFKKKQDFFSAECWHIPADAKCAPLNTGTGSTIQILTAVLNAR